MANIKSFNIDGASYAYDSEEKNPLALKNVKAALNGELVYPAATPTVTLDVAEKVDTIASVKSSNVNVATVAFDGTKVTVTGVAAGSATVTVTGTLSSAEATATINVTVDSEKNVSATIA